MSQVLEEPGVRRPDAEVLAELETKGLAQVMREETWQSHGRAEFSAFEQALVKGRLKIGAYRELMAQTYFIYVAIEETTALLADDPVAGAFNMPELVRLPAIESDLAFYYGPNWRQEIKPLPITQRYVERIREMAAESPARWVSHHYTRYLADLSGGLMIDKGVKKAYKLDVDGRRFYIFDKIADANEFKGRYRGLLDSLPVSDDEKLGVIDEALRAYEFNILLINELSDSMAPFEEEIEVLTD